jgi:hypothetical protein
MDFIGTEIMDFYWQLNKCRCDKLILSQIANGYLSRITGPYVKIYLGFLQIFTGRTVAHWNVLLFQFHTALLFSCIPDFLPKFSRLSLHPYFSIPHFLSYRECVRKVAMHLHKMLEVMSTSVYTGLNPFNFIRKHFLQICLWDVSYVRSYCSF